MDERSVRWVRPERTDGSELELEASAGDEVATPRSAAGLVDVDAGLPIWMAVKFLKDWDAWSSAANRGAVSFSRGLIVTSGRSSAVGRPNLAVKVKMDPLPGMAVPSILPPCSSTSWREMTRPRPLPPCWRGAASVDLAERLEDQLGFLLCEAAPRVHDGELEHDLAIVEVGTAGEHAGSG